MLKLIVINEKMIDSKSGYSKNWIEVDKKQIFWKLTWINEVAEIMNERKVILH